MSAAFLDIIGPSARNPAPAVWTRIAPGSYSPRGLSAGVARRSAPGIHHLLMPRIEPSRPSLKGDE